MRVILLNFARSDYGQGFMQFLNFNNLTIEMYERLEWDARLYYDYAWASLVKKLEALRKKGNK